MVAVPAAVRDSKRYLHSRSLRSHSWNASARASNVVL